MTKKASMPNNKTDSSTTQAMISKLTTAKKDDNKPIEQDLGMISNIGNNISEKIKNNENITQLFPDVELSIQILTSSILAPNDMLTPTLNYKIPEQLIPSDINRQILDTIKTYMTNTYDLENALPDIVREALFTKGSYAEAIIPEASVDEIVNKDMGNISLEDFTTIISKNEPSINLLGSPSTTIVSNEDFSTDITNDSTTEISEEDLLIDITENHSLLSVNDLFSKQIDNKVDTLYSDDISTEDNAMLDNIFRKTNYKENGVITVNEYEDTTRDSIGKPLVFKLSPESIVPVYNTSDVTKHFGYFVLLNESGSPITSVAEVNEMNDNIDPTKQKTDNKLNIINKAKTALSGITKNDPKIANMEEIYSKLVERKIKERLSSGVYSNAAAIEDNNPIYKTMFSRALAGQKTRLLFLPRQLVAYYAFDYRENGTGKSMLEKVSMLFSIRSILLFSRLMANIKNSVTTTKVTATLEEHDPDPKKTAEAIVSETLKTRQTKLPMGVTKIDDLVDWSHKVGFTYNFKHPKLPNMDIETSDENTSKVVPDNDLDESIQEHIIMSFGLTAEMVRSGYDSDFASTVLANNILLAKRVTQYQNKLSPQISAHVRKLLSNDKSIRTNITKIVTNNLTKIKSNLIKKLGDEDADLKKYLDNSDDKVVKYIVNIYLNRMYVTLPKPEVTESDNMSEAFTKYTNSLEDYLDLIMSSDALPDELFGEMSDNIDNIKVIMKTILTKKWMTDNGYMPEVNQFLTKDEDGKPIFNLLDEYNDYTKALADAILPFLKKNIKTVTKLDEKLEKLGDEEEEEVVDDVTETEEEVTDDTSETEEVVEIEEEIV